MKAHWIKLIVSLFLITSSCNKDDNAQQTSDYGTDHALFKFLKAEGSSFQEGEIQYRDAYTIEGDTIYNDWLPFPVAPEGFQLDEDLIFGDLVIAYSYPEQYYEGNEWNRSTMYWFKYLDSDTIDFFRVRDSGKYNEYRHLDYFLNGEPIESFHELHGNFYYFEIIKEGP